MNRLYLMPMVGVGTREDPRRPKYRDSILTPAGVAWASMDYGFRQVCILAGDIDDTTHTSLTGNTDVQAFPDGFESSGQTVGGALNAVRNKLEEEYFIPSGWVQASDTFLNVAHTIGGLFQFMQRLNSVLGNVNPFAGATLNDTFSSLPQPTRQAIIAATTSFGWDTDPLTGSTTLREMLKYLGDQWGAAPLRLGSFVF